MASRDRQPAREGARHFGSSRLPTCPECGAQRTVNASQHPDDSPSGVAYDYFYCPVCGLDWAVQR